MADPETDAIDTRRKFVEAWNKTMIDIWQEQIVKLGVIDTKALWRSTVALPVKPDGRFYDITLSQKFLEYGLWQDLGVGRELRHGDYEHNREHIEKHGRVRERRRWFSVKYYSSVMRLRDFMANPWATSSNPCSARLSILTMRSTTLNITGAKAIRADCLLTLSPLILILHHNPTNYDRFLFSPNQSKRPQG